MTFFHMNALRLVYLSGIILAVALAFTHVAVAAGLLATVKAARLIERSAKEAKRRLIVARLQCWS